MESIDPEFITRATKMAQENHPDVYFKENEQTIWQRTNKVRLKESQKKYMQTEKYRRARAKRTEALKAELKRLTEEELIEIKGFYAECPADMVVDHIIPISKGGKHEVGNLQYLTLAENSSKGSKLPGYIKLRVIDKV